MNEAKTTTRKQILTIKYNNLIKKLKNLEFLKGKIDIFPSLDEIAIGDIVFFMKMLFTNNDDEFKQNLKDALALKNIIIEESNFLILHAEVYPFLLFLYNFI